MRLFIGIEMSDSVKRAAAEVIDELKGRIDSCASRARVSWVSPDRLHVTVRFIGASDEARSEAVRAALFPTLETPGFELAVEGVGAFPPKGAPRVFWAGLTEGRQSLLSVEREVAGRLDAIVAPESRPYAPHLTLARVKDPAGLPKVALFDGLSPRFGTVRVEAITLFESRLSPKGPTYVALQRTALRRRADDVRREQ